MIPWVVFILHSVFSFFSNIHLVFRLTLRYSTLPLDSRFFPSWYIYVLLFSFYFNFIIYLFFSFFLLFYSIFYSFFYFYNFYCFLLLLFSTFTILQRFLLFFSTFYLLSIIFLFSLLFFSALLFTSICFIYLLFRHPKISTSIFPFLFASLFLCFLTMSLPQPDIFFSLELFYHFFIFFDIYPHFLMHKLFNFHFFYLSLSFSLSLVYVTWTKYS